MTRLQLAGQLQLDKPLPARDPMPHVIRPSALAAKQPEGRGRIIHVAAFRGFVDHPGQRNTAAL
jgi:hypothetical protein